VSSKSHYRDTEQNKTDRAHGSSPSPIDRDGRSDIVAFILPS
jgi:hypothetical protein